MTTADPTGTADADLTGTANPTGAADPTGTADAGPTAERRREIAVQALRTSGAALGQLVGGLRTAAMALGVLVLAAVAAVTAPAGVGLLLMPTAVRALHALADRERERLARWGPEIVAPAPPPTAPRAALADPTTRRELRWALRHASLGFLLGLLGVWLPLAAFRDTLYPLVWPFMPPDTSSTSFGFGVAHTWTQALAVSLVGVGWIAVILGLTPGMARLQARPARTLLRAGPDTDLSLRVAELTATRAAALDAHASELRRIERSLHDGTQNRIVTVTVLLGAARRMAARDPERADELLERAQSAAEQALAELRAVSRSILPPVLSDRGLAGALSGLAAECAVPCRTDVEAPQRCAASVEAMAYFVVAEALSNIAKHSGANAAAVTVRARGGRLHLRIEDDGRGGADEEGGSGLTGIRRRVAAHDGTLRVTSPAGGPTVLDVDLPCGT
ncbi:sensor domain-containing protein [Streptomyces bottropensis]|uniref:histidine kinase n=1 Tax=Streptomyces bottropensis TaxID=42235 RepID=A0ABU8B0K9_9ACTN